MDFRTLLQTVGLAPADVALCLHKPPMRRERDALAMMIDTAPELFEVYQSTHAAGPQRTLKSRAVMASFLMRTPGELVFVSLYRKRSWQDRTAADLDSDPLFRRVNDLTGSNFNFSAEAERTGQPGPAQFDFEPLPELAELKGRLIVRDPGSRAYMRLAETTPLEILEIARTPDLSPPMPDWRELVLDTPTLRTLPIRWAEQLRHWRGIYLIFDSYDKSRYVGAAYGEENLLGRWRAHVAGDIGVTYELSRRSTTNFTFSILELLSPAAPIEEVTRVEQQWMTRLHTRQFGLNR